MAWNQKPIEFSAGWCLQNKHPMFIQSAGRALNSLSAIFKVILGQCSQEECSDQKGEHGLTY